MQDDQVKGQNPVEGGLIGRAGVKPYEIVVRCGSSGGGIEWTTLFWIFIILALLSQQ